MSEAVSPQSPLVSQGSPSDGQPGERTLCLRCLRSQAVCFCVELRPFQPLFRTVILQHPRERRNSIGTARLTHLCVRNSLLFTGVSFTEDSRLNAILDDPENECVVLYPGADSLNLSTLSQRPAPERLARQVIFVIDGTWAQAKPMLRRNPRIAALPRICFTPSAPSGYRVRKQPHPHCLSTIEAVHEVTRLLDPCPEAAVLLQAFSRLVGQQVEYGGQNRLRELSRAQPAKLRLTSEA